MSIQFGEAFKIVYVNKSRQADEQFARRQMLHLLKTSGIEAEFVKVDHQGEMLIYDGPREDTLTRYNQSEQDRRQASYQPPSAAKDNKLTRILDARSEMLSRNDGELSLEMSYNRLTGGTQLEVTPSLLKKLYPSIQNAAQVKAQQSPDGQNSAD